MSSTTSKGPAPRRPGRCNMRGNCGKTSLFSPELPCALDEAPADEPDSRFRKTLVAVCGQDFASGPVCCTPSQVDNLKANLDQAEAIISSCPACRNNFRSLFCDFTCSPNQSQFLDVSRTQKTQGGDDGNVAVKTVEYHLSDAWREGFYDSCKDVKFGASNGFAMELIGGGAKDADGFLKFLGDEKPLLGSPFQINFPHDRGNSTPRDPPVRNCGDDDLLSRCACTDCPQTCAVLPHVDAPTHGEDRCQIGGVVSCFSLALVVLYVLALVGFLVGFGFGSRSKHRRRVGLRHRQSGISVSSEGSGYERVRLGSDDIASRRGMSVASDSDGSIAGGLLGATGLGGGGGFDGADARGAAGLGLASTTLDPLGTPQPRSYALNTFLTRSFYRLGLACAQSPWVTFALAAVFVGVCNLGWSRFQVETDPVRLWVAPHSEARLRKEYFDEHFGPFYRTQQVFVMDATGAEYARDRHDAAHVKPALDWQRLVWWADVEKAIRDIRTPTNGLTLQDVCFKPAGDGGPCVVQSIMGYFQDDLEGAGIGESNWREKLDRCTESPAECLPTFGQPLKSNVVLGGRGDGPSSAAQAVVTTWVVANSNNASVVSRAMEWEAELEKLLFAVASEKDDHPLAVRRRDLGLAISFSTEISLEQEIGSSSNADVGIIALSYVLMLLYTALSLGGNGPAPSMGESSTPSVAPSAPHGTPHRSGLAGRILSFLPSRNAHPASSLRRSRTASRFAHRLLVDSKFTLGLFGILVVLASVSSAVGVFSALGVKVTLIIGEVLPFLLLAVGVDNIFILCNEMDRQSTLASTSNPYATASMGRNASRPEQTSLLADYDEGGFDDDDDDSLEGGAGTPYGPGARRTGYYLSSAERAARALSRMGPSILLSATTQVTAFLLGALVPMPAVRNFALYAAGSMAIAAVLQCTVFVAAMALDADRTEKGRIDCAPCLRLGGAATGAPGPANDSPEGFLGRLMRRHYAPWLIRPVVKRIVFASFGALLVAGLIGIRHVEMGLDQRLALPPNSYLRDYFDAVDTFLDVGPPVYFVARKVDPSQRPGQQALCGRFTTCNGLSLANTLEGERKRPEVSFIAEPASSWIDDFLQWTNPVLETCCRVRRSDPNVFCSARDNERLCKPCFEGREPAWNITLNGMPEGDEFRRYLAQWLISPTDENCPLGGQAAYSSALSLDDGTGDVVASHFRTYHTPLRSQNDMIDALAAAERISYEASQRNSDANLDVFAYSLFYVFFEQYAHLVRLAAQVLGAAAVAIFGITTLMLGSWRTGLVVVGCVTSAMVGVGGAMGFLGIGFNALTLVNLGVCAAICVEFCSHVARAFMRAPGALPRSHPMAQKERDERAWAALSDVGKSVLSGITGTKLVGISVLSFTRSELLKLYYARMWASLIVIGALHGLVLLPVALATFGGRGYSTGEDEVEVSRRLARAHEQNESGPFAAGDEGDEESLRSDEL